MNEWKHNHKKRKRGIAKEWVQANKCEKCKVSLKCFCFLFDEPLVYISIQYVYVFTKDKRLWGDIETKSQK